MRRLKIAGKMVVTGAHSRMGTRLSEQARRLGWIVRGMDIAAKDSETIVADISKKAQILRLLKKEKPDCVIHTAAYTDVDGCETKKDFAWKTNVIGTANAAESALSVKARLIHISTDYVFDGKSGPYSESDRPCPVSHYGLTKLESEKAVRSIDGSALVARTCVPYDWNTLAAPNFVMWLVQQLKDRKRIRIVTDQWNTPTFMPQMTASLLDLAPLKVRGVLNVSGGEFINRYDFAVKACRIFGFDPKLIEPCKSSEFPQIAPRPMRAGLVVKKAEYLLRRKMFSADEGLKKTLELYRGH